ncbi:hypothetical protein BH23GEM6_BH23GEM6_06240 [soil metagenome]
MKRGAIVSAALSALLCVSSTLWSQEISRPLRISTAVVPETVTVGDRFRSVLRLDGLQSAAEFMQLPVGDTVQPVDSLQVLTGESPTAVYSLVAWHTGDDLEARIPVRVQIATGEFVTYIVSLRLPVVRSVLPEDTTALTPRPHRAVFAVPRRAGAGWWIWVALALSALALATILLWRHLRRQNPSGASAGEPRQEALRKLEQLQASGMVTVEHHLRLYPEVTRILRDYLATVDAEWGRDLTSSELISRADRDDGHTDLGVELEQVLAHADAVKFGRRTPTSQELSWFWSTVVGIVENVPRRQSPAALVEVAA